MRKNLTLLWLVLLGGPIGLLNAQDTTVVQTLTFDSTARAGTWQFPADTGQTYRKIIMQYRMRCHNAAVGNGNTGCREWDYSCNTVIRDSSQVDSARLEHPTHTVTGFSGATFDYTFVPTYAFIADTQYQMVYNSVVSESAYDFGVGAGTFAPPFEASIPAAKSQFLWRASELTGAGLTAGPITGMRLDLASLGSQLRYLRVRLRVYSGNALTEIVPDGPAWQDVYFLSTQFPGTGLQTLPFFQAFNWNGTDNLLVEFSYDLNGPGSNYSVRKDAQAFSAGVHSVGLDRFCKFDGVDDRIVWTPSGGNVSFPQMTVEFYARVTRMGQGQYKSFFNIGNTGRDFQIDLDGNDNIRLLGDNQTGNFGPITGDWQHVAVTLDSASQTTTLYLDGVNVATLNGTVDNLVQDLTVGENRNANNRVEAHIDEFRVWNTVRTATEIQDNRLRRLAGNESGLFLYYRFDEEASQPAGDATPGNRTGLKFGGPFSDHLAGRDIFKALVPTADRPRTTFLRGVYNQTLNALPVVDSIAFDPNIITEFGLNGSDLDTLGTFSGWAATMQYVYDAQGNAIDSVAPAVDSSLAINSFNYFRKGFMDLELMSFVTPYGNGLDLGPTGEMWEFDVTDFAPVLHGPVYMYLHRGGQNQEEMDIKFLLIEGTPPREVKSIRNVWPLTGTLGQPGNNYANYAADRIMEPRDVVLPANESEWKIRTMITGHGQEGEFIPRDHFVNIDQGPAEWNWTVWKECADVPVYPQGGTWLFDRSGWCPGDPTDLQEFPLDSLAQAGDTINVEYGIQNIGNPGDTRYLTSHLLVGYGPKNFALNAAIEKVKVPSDRSRYARFNPACSQPTVIIKNEGSTPLTSLEFSYNVRGGTPVSYSWTGSLAFRETEEVILPLSNPTFWNGGTANVFEVRISQPNGGTDEQTDNDVFYSAYEPWAVYSGGLSVNWRTNNNGNETTWKVYDENDSIVAENTIFLGPNLTLIEDLNLPAGCYKLRFDDVADNGLYYWFYPQNGQGYARLVEFGTLREAFEPEFGRFFEHHFWTDGLTVGREVTQMERMSIWPNPSGSDFNFALEGLSGAVVQLAVFDLQGRRVWAQDCAVTGGKGTLQGTIGLAALPAGRYLLKVQDGDRLRTKMLQKL